jgi:REP element-mobilizing transposase RayT
VPVPYLITFRTYATWFHGDERGSVDRDHNMVGTPVLPPDPARAATEARAAGVPVELDREMRAQVEQQIREVAEYRCWTIHALNVRSNHVHVVVTADRSPERVMNELKSWCTRRLTKAGRVAHGSRVWSRHGSTRYLNTEHSIARAIEYVRDEQGPMPD